MAPRPGARANSYVRAAAKRYGVSLRKIARHIGELARDVDPDDPQTMSTFDDIMNRYARLLLPWARTQASAMLAQVDARDKAVWYEHAKQMGQAVREEINRAPTGRVFKESMARQVDLITSLPTDAAQRVHKLAINGLASGMRADEVSEAIMATGQVTKSRANLIARTEVGRASTEFSRARAKSAGSVEYIWRTVGDARVRDTHVDMEGTVHSWDNPPAPEGKEKYHPGCFPNCRCWAEPILPDD